MADDKLPSALDTVARKLIDDLVQKYADWGDYPEIGDLDWESVLKRADEIANVPTPDTHDAAYDYLTQRAGDDTMIELDPHDPGGST